MHSQRTDSMPPGEHGDHADAASDRSEATSPYFKQAINSLEAALQNATVLMLEGQQHNAMDTARRALAAPMITFATEAVAKAK